MPIFVHERVQTHMYDVVNIINIVDFLTLQVTQTEHVE